MKGPIILVLFFITSILAIAQDSKYQKLFPFDNEKFKQQLQEDNRFESDSFKTEKDSILKSNESRSIRTFKVPSEKMAKMPNMPFNKDVHYTMLIKKYELNYPYTKKTLPRDYKPSNDFKLYAPLKDRKK